jgi:hypothetical protein
MKFKWLKKIKEYFEDKALAEKCGMVYRDICSHEYPERDMYPHDKSACKKCGAPYEGF